MAKLNRANKISNLNLQVYTNKKLVKDHSTGESFHEVEEVALDEIKENIRSKKILDTGRGVERTIKYLTEISNNDAGIDYSQAMIDECRRRYLGVNVLCCDTRDMSIFKHEEFDFIICAFNTIDYIYIMTDY